ncbi:MAG: hypothetical protein JO283_20950 [Bradyrhizobium sp.]|nr:hypothetical protein [Bradyrhizobium sp.]
MAFLKQFPDVCWCGWIGRKFAAYLGVDQSAGEDVRTDSDPAAKAPETGRS